MFKLDKLTAYLGGPQIYMKRDDLTGIGFGGNKNRKLEFLLADALENDADVILTEGAVQSNHCLQTAAMTAKLDLDCELVLSGVKNPEEISGNLLLFQILDTKIHRVAQSSQRMPLMEKRAEELKSEGRRPCILPTGGSTAVGLLGYIECMKEISNFSRENDTRFDHFIHATGSAGTQAGILLGNAIYKLGMDIFSINIGDDPTEIAANRDKIIREFMATWKVDIDLEGQGSITDGYQGEGYGIVSDELIATIKLVAKLEGIFLDPVYNGKAMVGMIDLIKKGIVENNTNVIFLHSGGTPALFAYHGAFEKHLPDVIMND